MAIFRGLVFCLLLGLALACRPYAEPPEGSSRRPQSRPALKATILGPGRVRIDGRGPGSLVRSTSPLAESEGCPQTLIPALAWPVIDDAAADGTTYCYALVRAGAVVAQTTVETPARSLPPLRAPALLVDKSRYTLTVLDGGKVVKRYPVALGRQPIRRKLCQDNASTPEGRYRISQVQPRATFHRAYDIDYPNAVDRFRYGFHQRHENLGGPGIGGEIQIHGEGSHRNWTFGCIALDNAAMDELFEESALGVGTEVVIVGEELGRDDLVSIEREREPQVRQKLVRLGLLDPARSSPEDVWEALGLLQRKRHLPLTCQLDRRTARSLGLDPGGSQTPGEKRGAGGGP